MTIETYLPRKMVSGENSLECLKDLKGSRASIILSGTFARINPGVVDRVKSYLKGADIEWQIVHSQGQEPSLQYVKKAARDVREFAPDIMIAIGGGSTMDAAKIMEVLYEYPDISHDDLFDRFNLPPIRNKIKSFIAVPTTSGTGSEVTPYNVVLRKVDNPVIPLIKESVVDYQTLPDLVILDPVFTASMPPEITANTGMDALVHAIEAYISNKPKNPMADLYALEAIKLIFEYLPAAYKDGNDMEARSMMQYAATMAGIAISHRGTGLAHGAGQQLGPVFGVRHGLSVSIVLEPVLKYNLPSARKELLNIADYLGIKGETEEVLLNKFYQRLRCLINEINFPRSIQKIGINRDDYLDKIDIMAENALTNGATGTNPRKPTVKEIKEIFMEIC